MRTMQDKNELSDIVLNKNGSSNSNKKTILAVATLGVVLIIVVLLMKPGSSKQENMMQPVPPKPQSKLLTNDDNAQEALADKDLQEPLFEEVEVIEESPASEADLDKIAQKLKQESQVHEQKSSAKKAVVKNKTKKEYKNASPASHTKKAVAQAHYYIQVGSFSKYEPNKTFLNSITRLGYKYKYHKVGKLNKVLVGPFPSREAANKAKKVLRSKVEPGAFLVKL
jgi:DedD protein